jgi:hypothetical protein
LVSLSEQIEALRAYAAREGYEVLEEAKDPGQSEASLEHPGMDRVQDPVASRIPQDYYGAGCPEPCLPLFEVVAGDEASMYELLKDDKVRFSSCWRT